MTWPTAAGRFEDVFFLDEDRGWIAHLGRPGSAGSIYRTTDGGAWWERAFVAPGIFPRTVGFATPERGWLGNLNHPDLPPEAPLFETLDGGETWHDVSDRISGPLPYAICGIFVLDGDNIYAVGRFSGPAFFLRSNDGGDTWTSSDLAPLASGLVDVRFLDPSNGIAVGGIGESYDVFQTVVLRTEDGGDSWRQVYRSQTKGLNAWKISFPTPLVGYVSTQGLVDGGIVLKTEDAGRTWREMPVGPGAFYSGIGFISPDTGWVAGESVIYLTNDGALTWSEATFGERVNRIRFLRSGLGYAAGEVVYRFVP